MPYNSLTLSSVVFLQLHRVPIFIREHCHELSWVDWLQASKRQLPMLVDAERLREGLDDMLTYATYVVASSKFPQVILFAKFYCLYLLCTKCNHIVCSYDRPSEYIHCFCKKSSNPLKFMSYVLVLDVSSNSSRGATQNDVATSSTQVRDCDPWIIWLHYAGETYSRLSHVLRLMCCL